MSALVKVSMLRGRRKAPEPPGVGVPSREVAFEDGVGGRLAGRWFAAPRPRGVVVLCHPDKRAGKQWFERAGWIDLLHENGYEALTFDFPAYGGSRGPSTYYHKHVLAAVKLAREWSGFLPVHVVGVSMGAFAAANASPRLHGVSSLILESPYPTFESWYHANGDGMGLRWTRMFRAVFPATARAIQADRNIAGALPPRILVALAEGDRVTPPALTEAIHRAAPADRARLLRVQGVEHLGLLQSEAYRRAVLETLAG